MKKLWGGILLISILLCIASIWFLPYLAVAFIVFWPIFAFISVMPTILLYIATFAGARHFATNLKIKRKKLFIVSMILSISFGIPLLSNILTYLNIARLTAFDHNTIHTDISGETIILSNMHHAPQQCNSLCQKLLYNGAFKEVISVNTTRIIGGSFTIENRENCPSIYYAPNNINNRIAAGECLISKEIDPKKAKGDYIYKLEGLVRSSRKTKLNPFALWISAKRLTLIKTENNEELLRKTKVRAKPLFAPLLLTLSGGYQLDFDVAFARYKNNFDNYASDEDITKTIFKENFSDPVSENINQYEVIKRDIRSESEEKLMGHKLFEKYLGSFLFSKKTPTNEDIDLVIEALSDPRINNWSDLARFNRALEEIPDTLILAMGERIAKDGNQGLSHTIRFLPEKRAAIIYPYLLKVMQTPELRKKASEAITRLSDGGLQAVSEYRKILLEYKKLIERLSSKDINSVERAQLEKNWKDLGEAPIGAVKGLCRLGNDAKPVADTLISIVNEHDTRNFAKEIIKTLISLDAIDDLQQKYPNNEKLNKAISREIKRKQVADKNNSDFCK